MKLKYIIPIIFVLLSFLVLSSTIFAEVYQDVNKTFVPSDSKMEYITVNVVEKEVRTLSYLSWSDDAKSSEKYAICHPCLASSECCVSPKEHPECFKRILKQMTVITILLPNKTILSNVVVPNYAEKIVKGQDIYGALTTFWSTPCEGYYEEIYKRGELYYQFQSPGEAQISSQPISSTIEGISKTFLYTILMAGILVLTFVIYFLLKRKKNKNLIILVIIILIVLISGLLILKFFPKILLNMYPRYRVN